MKYLLFCLFSISLFSFTNPVVETGGGIGDKAPNFSLKNIDGKMYSLEDVKAANGEAPKGIILIFTCNTCPFAVAYEERIVELHNTFSAQGYPVVAIQPNDPAVKPGDGFEAMKTNAKEKNFEFLYLLDEGQKVYPQYNAKRTPEVFLLDKDHVIRYHGAIDDNARDASSVKEKFLENAIKAIERGEQPTPAETKAIGCSIKTT